MIPAVRDVGKSCVGPDAKFLPRGKLQTMSGVFCDGCGEGNLLSDPGGRGAQPVACDLCGWKADLTEQPRKWMEDDGVPWTKRERKKAGTLFFLWLHLDSAKGDAVFQVMDILGIHSMSGSTEALVELEKKPTDEMLERLARVDGVTRIWLAP